MNLLVIAVIVTGIAIAAVGFYWRRAQRDMEQAKVQAAWLNKELAQADSRIEVVEIWSNEQIDQNNSKVANAILEKVGTALSADQSVEAKRVRDFLATIHPDLADSEQKTQQEVALAWFSCLQLQDKEPESELAQLFKVLNDAWATTRDGQAQISDLHQIKILRAGDTTVAKNVPQS
jgi:outer membrane protein TolC